jgi:hypothetical protein
MFSIISHKIKDQGILSIVRDIIYSIPGGRNMPIGNFTSQWFSNLYLNELDRFVKSNLRLKCYLRYCDDFCLFGNDKAELNAAARKIIDFAKSGLGLEFSKCNLAQVAQGIDFIGYRHFKKFILVRKSTVQRIRRKANSKHGLSGFAEASYFGWLKHACAHKLSKRLIPRMAKRPAGFAKNKNRRTTVPFRVF